MKYPQTPLFPIRGDVGKEKMPHFNPVIRALKALFFIQNGAGRKQGQGPSLLWIQLLLHRSC